MIGSAQYKKEMEGNCMREESETNGKRRKKRNAIQDAFFGTLCFCCLLWTLIFLHPTGLSSKSVMNPICYSEEMTDGEQKAEGLAKEIEEEHKERLSPFTFSKCNIQAGEYIFWGDDPDLQFKVLDDKTVEYKGKPFSLSGLAALLLGKSSSAGVAGPRYFKYNGEWLNDIRHRLEG